MGRRDKIQIKSDSGGEGEFYMVTFLLIICGGTAYDLLGFQNLMAVKWSGNNSKQNILLFSLKNFRGSEILSFLKVTKLIGHSFMDDGRKHETKGSPPQKKKKQQNKIAYYS